MIMTLYDRNVGACGWLAIGYDASFSPQMA